MKVWVFVEGEGDRNGLTNLWQKWQASLGEAGWGMAILALQNKSQFLRKIGHRAAEKLCADPSDLVVALPDLYPYREYDVTPFRHRNAQELQQVQKTRVSEALRDICGLKGTVAQGYLNRFYASCLKHDLEMLLLAAQKELREYLRTQDQLGKWRQPVEDQDDNTPPKRVVESLFKTKLKRAYRDTKDAGAVLKKVADLSNILFDSSQRTQCPVFKATLDWIANHTNVPAYRAAD